jgi:hypothetical protein
VPAWYEKRQETICILSAGERRRLARVRWTRQYGPQGAVTQLLGVLLATDTSAQTSANVARSRVNELL